MGRGDLSDEEWARLEPHLPRRVGRGGRWQCHRRVINGILFRQRTGLPWRDLPSRFGKWKTVHDRHRRWSADGTWEKTLRAVQADADAEGQIDWSMVSVDSTSCRAHQHAAGARSRPPRVSGRRSAPIRHRTDEALGRSRGGLTCKIHLAGEGGRRPLAFVITPGQWGDAPQLIPGMEQIRVPPAGWRTPTYSARPPRRRQSLFVAAKPPLPAATPDQAHHRGAQRPACQPPAASSQGGRPTGFDREIYRRRNEVERTINRLKSFRALATRYDKRAYVFHGTVTGASIRLWLRA